MRVSVAWRNCPAVASAMADGVAPLLLVSHHRATLHGDRMRPQDAAGRERETRTMT